MRTFQAKHFCCKNNLIFSAKTSKLHWIICRLLALVLPNSPTLSTRARTNNRQWKVGEHIYYSIYFNIILISGEKLEILPILIYFPSIFTPCVHLKNMKKKKNKINKIRKQETFKTIAPEFWTYFSRFICMS